MTFRSLIPALTLGVAVLLTPQVASAAEGFVRSATTLRAGPSSDYPRVARVARGESLDIIGCLARGSWCDVVADGDRGWLPGSRIDFLDRGRRTHLSGNFAGLGLGILSFGLADYWGSHYSGRPWVNDRRWQRGDRRPTRTDAGPTSPPTGIRPPVSPPGRGDTPPPPRTTAPQERPAPHVAPAPHRADPPRQPPQPHAAPDPGRAPQPHAAPPQNPGAAHRPPADGPILPIIPKPE